MKISRSIFSPIGNSQAPSRQTEQKLKQHTMSMEQHTFTRITEMNITEEQCGEILELIQWEWQRGWAEGYEVAIGHLDHTLSDDATPPLTQQQPPRVETETLFRVTYPAAPEWNGYATLADLYEENRDTLTVDEYMTLCHMGVGESLRLGRYEVTKLLTGKSTSPVAAQ